MDLKNRVAVITGGSRGIGAGVAREFFARGLRVALCGTTAEAAVELPGPTERTFYRRVDVTDLEALAAFAREVEDRFGAFDLWVNNAGVLAPIGMARSVDPLEFKRLLEVNVLGVFFGTRVSLERFRALGRPGTVINLGSGASTNAYPGWSAYCASKAAVDHFTRVVAKEEESFGNRVFCLAPGIIETAMQELIRRQSEEAFPAVEKFREFKRDGRLLDAGSPAPAMLHLAFHEDLRWDDPVFDARNSPEFAHLHGA